MIGFLFSNPVLFFVWLLALVVAITVHEFAHAWTAVRLGDPTPKIQGRLTLNPLAHMDPLGTLMLLVVRFGWGKPVQFDPFNLENPKRDAAIISLAGPVSNLIVATGLSILARLGVPVMYVIPFIFLNVVLAVFNLLPIHPLDGGKILIGLLPPKDAAQVDIFLRQYGLLILLLLIFPTWQGMSPVSYLINPVVSFLLNFLLPGNGII